MKTLKTMLMPRLAAGLAVLTTTAARAHEGHGDHDALGVLDTLIHPLELHDLLWIALLIGLAARAWTVSRRGAGGGLALALAAAAVAAAGGLALLGRA